MSEDNFILSFLFEIEFIGKNLRITWGKAKEIIVYTNVINTYPLIYKPYELKPTDLTKHPLIKKQTSKPNNAPRLLQFVCFIKILSI